MKWSLKSTKIPKDEKDLKKILFDNRNIKQTESSFFNPTHPLEISLKEAGIDEKILKKVIKRIQLAKKNKEYIVIFGDYDADGVCATAILWQLLFDLGCDVKPFIPHRKKHGYGVSIKAVDSIIEEKKPDLIITVDNGIVAHEPVNYIKSKGIDIIITDHHAPETADGKLIFPNADFILHSSKLCGATLSWMLTRELELVEKSETKLSASSLDLCGIATIADQVKLFEINRSFAKFGIEAIKKTNRAGLKFLLKETVKDIDSLDSDTVGFVISPRINAMGRMADGTDALRFLCTKNEKQAKNLAKVLIETNEQRKTLTYELLADAEKQIELISQEKIIIVHSQNYHEGILGLIAGAILEKYSKPAIAISIGTNFAKASVRSVAGVNIVEFLRQIRDDLLEVGGHPMAAGFGFEPSKLEQIKLRLFNLAKEQILDDKLVQQIEPECILPVGLAKLETVDLVQMFEPFGQGNKRPIFQLQNLKIIDIKTMGSENTHLIINLGNDGNNFKAIGWKMGKYAAKFKVGDEISVVGSLEFNNWNGRQYLQMILKDLKLGSKA